MTGPDGTVFGTVAFTTTSSGIVGIAIELSGLPAGAHAIHIHETADCSAPDFSSAGGHFALGRNHGILTANGPHPGDLPNLYVGDSGEVKVDVFSGGIALEDGAEATLIDADGSAVVIHAGADDYASQPAGDAGDRIACGIVTRQ
jgi:Cu-Zn family superoxide dismutase